MTNHYHREIITDLSSNNGDGLMILGRGLGMRHMLTALISIHANDKNLVLMLNATDQEFVSLRDLLNEAAFNQSKDEPPSIKIGGPDLFRFVNNQNDAKERYYTRLLNVQLTRKVEFVSAGRCSLYHFANPDCRSIKRCLADAHGNWNHHRQCRKVSLYQLSFADESQDKRNLSRDVHSTVVQTEESQGLHQGLFREPRILYE